MVPLMLRWKLEVVMVGMLWRASAVEQVPLVDEDVRVALLALLAMADKDLARQVGDVCHEACRGPEVAPVALQALLASEPAKWEWVGPLRTRQACARQGRPSTNVEVVVLERQNLCQTCPLRGQCLAVFGGRCACQCLLHFIRRCALPAFCGARGPRRSPPAVAAAVPVVLAAVVVHTGVALEAARASQMWAYLQSRPCSQLPLLKNLQGVLLLLGLGGSCFLPLPEPFACFFGLSFFM